MGFDKDIEQIIDILGSKKSGSSSDQKSASRFSGYERQNVLLSATLNDKVNRLANISLENPVMVGLDSKNLPPKSLVQKLGSSDSDSDDETVHTDIAVSSSNGNYNLPAQLVQRYVKGDALSVLHVFGKHSQ